MADSGFALFECAIGACAIAWRPSGLVGLQLPEADQSRALARLRRRFPDLARATPPVWVKEVIKAIRKMLTGERVDLAAVPIDLAGISAFEAAVYRAARAIPFGETATYGSLAATLGDPGQTRAVGQALGRNPWPIVVPCHRVTGAEGRIGGFSAPGGADTKMRLLEIEGAFKAETLPLFATRPS